MPDEALERRKRIVAALRERSLDEAYDLSWTDGGRTVTTPDLLARTVLYKVGHHGSHNATLRERGLEMMTHPDLVAMVPVDRRVAHDIKKWTRMPFEPLMTRLKEKTRGRILRSDQEKEELAAPAGATAAEAGRYADFLKRVKPGGGPVQGEEGRALYFDYTLPL